MLLGDAPRDMVSLVSRITEGFSFHSPETDQTMFLGRALERLGTSLNYKLVRRERRTRGYLNKSEVQAIMARRDKVVEHFHKLIAEKGESAILYLPINVSVPPVVTASERNSSHNF